ncbi:MAG: hypothetical protein ACYTFG_04490 [Planctomycetota bacterium]|jgi:hypothetical protein
MEEHLDAVFILGIIPLCLLVIVWAVARVWQLKPKDGGWVIPLDSCMLAFVALCVMVGGGIWLEYAKWADKKKEERRQAAKKASMAEHRRHWLLDISFFATQVQMHFLGREFKSRPGGVLDKRLKENDEVIDKNLKLWCTPDLYDRLMASREARDAFLKKLPFENEDERDGPGEHEWLYPLEKHRGEFLHVVHTDQGHRIAGFR